eukprot:573565-Rhodomonas_salina.1
MLKHIWHSESRSCPGWHAPDPFPFPLKAAPPPAAAAAAAAGVFSLGPLFTACTPESWARFEVPS